MEEQTRLRKNPSREACEGIIKRILMTEMQEKGKNEHFRNAADFMRYFESLYPASDALTKQVQRAIKALNMPKDERGYFIPDKTTEQFEAELELRSTLQKANASVLSLADCEPVFLKADASLRSYLLHLIERSPLFKDCYVTLVESMDGLLFYTRTKDQLMGVLESFCAEL